MIHEPLIGTVTAVAQPEDKNNTFSDPLESLFLAHSTQPADLYRINLRVLSPFHRALLVIDGTVTKFIEAYTMEPIDIIRLSQAWQQLPIDHSWLAATAGTNVLTRQVLLRGHYSYRLYAYAVSLIIPERLPQNIQDDLAIDGGGIGRILNSSQMETRREVLWYGQEKSRNLPPNIGELAYRNFASRTYRIITNNQPVMLINEKFPYGDDSLPVHH
jgi:chorismate-pyruvate lyase